MKHQIFTRHFFNVKVFFACCLSIFLFSNPVSAQCPSDLDIEFTGDSDNDVCQNGENLILTLSGNNIPNNPNQIIWYGGLSEGTDPGELSDYGLTGIFYAKYAVPAAYTICADVITPGCETLTICENMLVVEEQEVDLDDAQVVCSISASGIFNLDGLIDGENSSSNIYGGEWTLDSNAGGNITANTLEYTSAGCYEVTYDPPTTEDNSCNADNETAYVLVTQQPQPNFDILDQICYVEGTNVNLEALVNSPIYKFNGHTVNANESWTSSNNSIATVNGAGVVTIQGTGTVQICLEETLNHASCGSNGPIECSEQFCQEILVIATPSDLDIVLTDDICNIESDRNLKLTGSYLPTNPDHITWFGGLDSGTNPGEVSDDGLNGTFYSNGASAGIYTICANVGHPECVVTICEDIIVVEEQIVTLVDGFVECSISASGIFNLDGLIDGGNSSSNAYGGVWTLTPNAGASIVGNSLQYAAAGCYEVTYDPPATLDDECDESAKTAYVLITQQPQPSFDIQDQVCYSAGDPAPNHIYPSKINSPNYSPGSDLTRTWTISSGPATVDNNGNVTITGTGTVMVCLKETIAYEACGSNAAGECEETFCQQISVSDGTAQDASFEFSDAEFCIGDVIILTANSPGGEFTGLDVVDDGNGMTGSYTITSCGSFPITYTLNDPNGCTATYTAHLNTDQKAPELTLPIAPNSAECGNNDVNTKLQAWRNSASATDNCPGVAVTSLLFNTISNCGNTEEQVWEFTATDACGNTTVGYASFKILDTTNPSIDEEAEDLTVECDGTHNSAALVGWLNNNGGAEASDICGNVTWSHDYGVNGNFLSNLCGATGTVTVTFTATDECGNASSISASFTIEDTTAPTITCPGDITLECNDTNNGAIVANWLNSASAFDVCSDISISNDYAALPACGSSVTVTFTVQGNCDGETITCSANISVIDSQKPVIMVAPSDFFVECDGSDDPNGAIAVWAAAFGGMIAVDQCDPNPDLSFSEGAPVSQCGGTKVIPYTFTATDDCGNLAISEVAYAHIVDTTAPEISIAADPGPISCELADPLAWASTAVTVDVEDCSGTTTDYALINIDYSCDDAAVYTYLFTVTDDCGNITTATGTYTTQDITDPVITAPDDLHVECGDDIASLIIAWLDDYTVSDNCSSTPDISVTNDFEEVPDLCGGSITITWTAEDDCGNTSTASAKIIVEDDDEGPTFVNCPDDLTVGVDVDECSAYVIYSTPVAEDCNGVASVVLTSGIPSGHLFPLGTTTIIFTATDECGNESTCEFDITVVDTDDPTIHCPSNDVVVCADLGTCTWISDSSISPTLAIENCPNYTIIYEITGATTANGNNDASGEVLNLGTSIITYTIMDANGNPKSVCSFNVIVEDCEAPTIDCFDELDVECGSEDVAAWIAAIEATASDICGDVTVETILFLDISSCGNTIEQQYLFTVTDEAGNTTTCIATYESDDTTNPTIDEQAEDLTVECDGATNTAALTGWLNNNGGAEASDICGNVSWSHDYGVNGNFLSNLCGATGAVPVTFTATDECGNSSSTTASFIIEDTTAPSITCPQDITLECNDTNNGAIVANWLNSASAFDVCSDISISNDYAALPACGSSVTVTFTVEGNCDGETINCSANISVIDSQKPIIMVAPSDFFVECDGSDDPNGAIAAWAASFGGMVAVDQCDPNPDLSFSEGAPVSQCGGTKVIPYTFSATDDCGNLAISEVAYAHIVDTTAPEISIAGDPGPISCELADPLAWASTAVTVDVEDCSGTTTDYALINIDYSCDDAAVYTYLFTVTDDCGNIATATGTYTTIDETAPVITAPDDLEVECDDDIASLLIAWLNDYTVSDNCSSTPDISVTNDFEELPDICGGSVTVTWTAEDDCGNTSTASAELIIEEEDEGPEFINCPDDLTVGVDVDECSAYVIYSTPVAFPECSEVESIVLTSGIPSGNIFPLGVTTIIFTATDECGNESTCEFDITVVDTDDPTIHCPSNDVVVCVDLGTCTWISDSSISPTLAIENCPNYTIIYEITGATTANGNNDASGEVLNLGTSIITYTIMDANGNPKSVCSFNIIVEDCEAPSIDCFDELDVECGSEDVAAWIAAIEATASDICGDVTVETILFLDISSCGNTIEQQYLFTVTDEAGNTTTCIATYESDDTTNPTIDEQAEDLTVECDGATNTAALTGWLNNNGGAEASDICGNVTWSHDYGVNGNFLSNLCGATGTVTVTFTATDECGNASSISASFTIEDTTAPTITCPGDITLECNDTNNGAIVANWLNSASAFDVCSDISISNDYAALPACGSSVTVTFTVQGNCDGETITCSANISVIDSQKPVIMVAPSDFFVECDGSDDPNGAIAVWAAAFGGMIAVDQCDPNPDLSFSEGAPVSQCGGTKVIPYTFTATDDCGNLAISEVAYAHIIDTTAPEISIAADPGPISCELADPLAWASTAVTVDVEDCSGTTTDYALINIDYSCDDAAVYTYLFTVTDDCGNITTATGTYTTQDITDPVITAPDDLHVECGDDIPSLVIAWLDDYTVSDNCSSTPDISVTNDFEEVPDLCGGSITVTWTAEDDCGNTSIASAKIIVEDDDEGPTFVNCPDDLTVGVDVDECSAYVIYSTPVAEDCNGVASVVLTSGIPSGDLFPLGTTTIIFTATDECGNESTCEFDITVVDTDDPTIHCPSNDVVVCADLGTCTWISDSSISPTLAIENCPNYTIIYEITGATTANGNNDASGEILNLGTSIITYTIMDANGNPKSVCSFNVIVEDCEAPTIDCYDELNIECGSEDVAAWIAAIEATATDLCGDVTVETILFLDISSCGNTIEQQYLFTVTDEAGNTTTCITTYESDDTINPTIDTAAEDLTVECDGTHNSAALVGWLNNNGGAEASDICGNVSWSHNYGVNGNLLSNLCGATGAVTVTFTATDDCGNSSYTSATFTIEDTSNPTWSISPINLTIECDGTTDPSGLIADWLSINGQGIAVDDCGSITYSNNYNEGDANNGGCSYWTGSATVTFTATDACGNFKNATAIVTIIDTTAPIVSCPSNITLNCNDAIPAPYANYDEFVAAGGSVFDECSMTDEGDIFTVSLLSEIYNNKTICPDDGMYTITRTYIATDACGNTATCSQDIMYNEDLTPPVIDQEASDEIVDCDGEGNAAELSEWLNNHGGATAIDECSEVTWTYDLISSLDLCSNTVIDTYRFTVTDACGNYSTTDANFIIQDVTPPILSGGENPEEECDDFGGNNDVELQAWLSSNGGLTADDACSDAINWSNDFDPIDSFTAGCGSTGVYTVTFTATDDCGNSDSETLTFTIVDTTEPVFINCPKPDVIVDAPEGWCASFANFSLPIATDNCSVPTVTQIDGTGLSSGSLFPVGTTILTWEAIDECGNSTTCMIKVIVNDYHTPPEIVCPSDVEVANDPLMCGAVVNDIALESVDDNCPDNLVITYTIKDNNGDLLECGFEDASGYKFPVGTSTVEYFVQDQPLLLITEISQSGAVDQIEITNFGPADMDISCLVIERNASNPLANESFIVPNGVIVASGETYVHDFTFDGGALMASCFTISYGNWVIDEVATNGAASCSEFTGNLASGDVYRISVCDTNTAEDWAIIDACNMASIGILNPGLPTLPANSTLSSLQSEAPSIATCSFEVTVNDEEDPFCAKHDSLEYNVPGLPLVINGNTACTEVNISINTNYIVGDVNIVDLEGNYPDMEALRFKLISPLGTEVLLFEELCAGEADFNLGLDDDADNSVIDAPCGPLGFNQDYAPIGLLKDFFGENALGIWTLEITSNSAEAGSLNNFVLEVNALEAYVPENVVLPNDDGECGAEYTWLHPLVGDNCCVGAISVEYTSDDADCVPTGGLLDGQGGYYATEFFCVGTTTVTYSLLDAAGNTSSCSFEVTVEDQENPVAICPSDITINLDAGECEQAFNFNVEGTDNCGIVNSWSIPPSGHFFEIGTTTVTIFVEDEAGNQNSCTFDVTVQDYPDPDGDLFCNNLVNLSLDASCEACITPDMILEGGPYNCYDNYIIEIHECHDLGGCPPIATSPCITNEYIGDTLIVYVIDPATGNYCWGQVYVEDKLIPEVECPEDVTIKCNASTDPSNTGEPILLSCEVSVDIEFEDVYNDNGNCGDPRATIERTWTITDESGNSTGCVQMITIDPFDLADITFPQDLDNFALPALECTDVQNDPSLTDPSNTGEPMINGQPLIQGGLCHYSTNVSDEIYDVCNSSYEILRTFKVRNMCLPLGPDNPKQHTQIIKVLDMTPPVIEGCGNAIQIYTTNNSCSAEFDPDVNGLIVTDECSGVNNISVSSSTGSFDLPLGFSTITYMATDHCGNIATCDVEVEVVDATPPVPICISSHVVGLTVNEPTYVGALVFDNGSFDNCELVAYQVRRMDNPNCPGNDATAFGDYVPFYCCDVNQNGDVVLVELQVTDAAGNTNSCMIEVEVQDKLNPAIQCPPNIVLDCYGDPYDLDVTGYATASDNCSAVVSHIDQGSIDNCGEGTIFRIWTATDPGGRTASCVQSIQVVNSDPFYISDNNCFNQDQNDGVIWPCDYETSTCAPGLTPDITGEPTIIEDGCDLIAVTYEDLELPIQAPACMKILRTWIVIDWCQYNSNTGEGYWEYSQVIKVLNSDDPLITSICEDVAFCSYDPDCAEGSATLVLEAIDDCTEAADLNYYYWIDLHSNGTDEIHDLGDDASDAHLDYTNGQMDFPIGTHTIRWDVEDGCGNIATCTYQFIITDCKAPTPILLNGIAVELMEDCTIELWATDWDDPSSPSFDNCGIAEWLVQSPSQGPGQTAPPATASSNWVFTSEGTQTVDIWILDVNGNWAYTTTYVLVENNIGPDCQNPSGGFQISGEISNEEAEMVEDVKVNLTGSIPGIPDHDMTEEFGIFEFPNLPESANYTVTPEKNINPLNGVSTFDLVLITKHILDIQKLDSPYKIIAADINRSGTVSAFDLVHLRKLILFIDDEFQENTSWRFVEAEFVFPNPLNPFESSFPEIFSVNDLSNDEQADFIGVKIGDVNGSAIANSLLGDGNTRNTIGDLELLLDDHELIAGETYELAFKASDFKTMLGYQFTLNFDAEMIEFNSFSEGTLDELNENNFGFTMLENGVITTSWNTSDPVDLENDNILFNLNFTAKKAGKLSEVLSLNSRYTKAEAYNTSGLLNVSLRFQSEDGAIVTKDRFELYQNQPNPFKDETAIGFYLPAPTTGTLTIYDVSGIEVKKFKGEFNAGYNEINVNRSELNSFGVLYYRLATPNGSAVKTMTLIR